MAITAGAVGFTAASGLKSSATLGAIGISLSGLYAMTGIGIPCPWRFFTHTLCPFCGSTTMGVALLHGDIVGAWTANAFVFLLLIGLTLACLCWLIEVLGGPATRLPRLLSRRDTWYAVLATCAITFALWRNLVPSG